VKTPFRVRNIHPILFAIFPVLSIFAVNSINILPGDVAVSALIVLFVSVLIWLGIHAILHDKNKAAILTSVFLFLFFSYRNLLFAVTNLFYLLGLDKIVYQNSDSKSILWIWLLVMFCLFALFTWKFLKSKWNLEIITKYLNIVSIALIAMVFVSMGIELVSTGRESTAAYLSFDQKWADEIANEPCRLKKTAEKPPDIYYIILDEFGRDDVLSDLYGVDNSRLISFLNREGFFVAEDSRANYTHTSLALSSYLNFDYLNRISAETGLYAMKEKHLKTLISDNRTFHQLKCLGYDVISFNSGFSYTEDIPSDTRYAAGWSPTDMETLLINNSPLALFLTDAQFDWHRGRVLYTLKTLSDLGPSDKPRIIFAHIVSPHPPFLFGENGEPVNPRNLYSLDDGLTLVGSNSREAYRTGYAGQVTFLSQKVQETIQGILKNSETPPIIVIQGDHGPASEYDNQNLQNTNVWERMSIFNAYYLPGKGNSALYNGITPVNTFRVIFNTYFDGGYAMLPDISYFSPDVDPSKTTDVSALIPENDPGKKASLQNSEP
jgi:hypothetical protein